ncbi:MAG: hypothetical protein M0Z80_14345 [Treponema sp.]|nr:hypothetical protein [Treponema sp.]
MAKRSNGLFSGLLFLLVFLFLVALNPTRDEFIAWMSARQADTASRNAGSDLIGRISSGVGGVAGTIEGGIFRRHNYGFFSLFSRDGGKVVYLGAAKLFLRLR